MRGRRKRILHSFSTVESNKLNILIQYKLFKTEEISKKYIQNNKQILQNKQLFDNIIIGIVYHSSVFVSNLKYVYLDTKQHRLLVYLAFY